ncbi:alpha-glucosidase domain-containing protein [Segatella albensis]|uniref:alpha-glucosidase domain-containing protein n=1 Tax=Segatella albensis TaxID=77768 RepID=UPI0006840F19|nr:alpha-glucosidase domain-containing protein [Segatella albensis]
MSTYAHSINKNQMNSSVVTRQIGNVKVSIQFYSSSIVRIVKYPASDAYPQKKSYSVIMKPKAVRIIGKETTDCITLSSSTLCGP